MFKFNINLIWGHYCPWDAIIKYLQRSLFTLSDLLPCFGLHKAIIYVRPKLLPQFSQRVTEHLCQFIDFS
jgi:hypothetical protein